MRLFFIWFGDVEPSYAQWSIENFKTINNNWEIKYICYTIDQIKNYKFLKDDFLTKSIEECIFKYKNNFTYNQLSDIYRWKILNQKYDVYLDLDTFPICKLDDFIKQHIHQTIGHFSTRCLGYCADRKIDDQWFICNTKKSCLNVNCIYKNIDLNDEIIYKNDIAINRKNIDILNQRINDFYNCKLKLNDNFCCKKWTPVEHYHLVHRSEKSIEYKIQKVIL